MTKIIPFQETTDPAAVADNIVVYSKDVGGVTQLFGRASDGTIYQITPPGGSSGIFLAGGSTIAATLAMSPDGATLYGGDQYALVVKAIATSDNSLVATVPTGQPGGMVVTPDGAFVYALVFGVGAVVIDTATYTVVTAISGFQGSAILMAPDGAHVYVLDPTNTQVAVIETATNTVVATPPTGTAPSAFAITPSGAFVCVANNGSDDVTVIETTTFTVLTTVALTQTGPLSIVAAPGNAHIYVGTTDGFITKIATATWTIVGAALPLTPAVGPFRLFINPANTRLYASSSNFVQVIDLTTFTVLTQTPDESPAFLTTFLLSPDGARLYLPYDDSQLRVIDTAAPTVILATVPVGSNTIDMIATPDSAKIYLADGNETLRMILAVDNSVTQVFASQGPFTTVSFPGATIVNLGGGVGEVDLGVSQYAFVYQPGGTPFANVYNDWATLCAAMSQIEGPLLLQMDDQYSGGGVTIPAGDWTMTDVVWEGIDKNYAASLGSTLVTFEDGAVVNGLRTIRGLRLRCLGAPAITDLTDGDVLVLDDYTVIGGFDNPVIDVSGIEVFKTATISARHGSQILQQALGITGLDNGTLIIEVDSASLLEANTVAGTGGGLVIKQSRVNDNVGGLQSFFTGGVQIQNSLGGFNLQPDSLLQLFGGTLNYFSLGGAVNANLTPANWQPGAIVVVKNTSGSGTVTINPSGSDTIDGAATYVITTGQGSVILVSDGISNWMIIGEKV